MIKFENLTASEQVNLSQEIALVAPMSTPLYSLLLANNKSQNVTSPIFTWREKTLDSTADITVPEGSETTVFQSSTRAELNNVAEILKKAVSVSGTAQATDVNGIADLFSSEVNDRLVELKINAEKKLINGTKDDGSVSGVRATGGLIEWVPATHKLEGAVTEANLKATVRKLWDAGLESGEYFAILNADAKESVDGLFAGQYSYIAQESKFGLVVSTYQTNYGNINFILDRHVPADKVVMFDVNYLSVANLRQPFFEVLGKTGDSVKGHVIAELGLKVLSPKALAMLTIV